MKEHKSYLILFLPWLAFFTVFTLGMVGYNLFVSFTDWRGIYPSFNFVGLENYKNIWSTSGFSESIKNVMILFFIGLPTTVGISTLLGILLDLLSGWMSSVLRGISIISMALGGPIVSLFWTWMFNYRYGGINQVLRDIGLHGLAIDWLGNSNIVMYGVVLMMIWRFCGFGALIISAGLNSIPKNQIEAAMIDGAGQRIIYMKVMLPQIKGQIFTLFLLMSMYLLQSFSYIWPLTGGGPGWASTLFPELAYRKMFQDYDFASGATIANLMFLLVFFIAIPYLYYIREEQNV